MNPELRRDLVVQSGSEGSSVGAPEVEARHVMDNKDAFDLWWSWAIKPLDSPLTIDAAIHDAVMALPPDPRGRRFSVT
jgi:hypothetical protein